MKQALILLLLVPTITFAQSKKKIKKQQEKARKEAEAFTKQLVSNLKGHVYFLADDKLQGRRTGTEGERLAMNYIAEQYKKIGLEAKGDKNSFIQPFEINEGKSYAQSALSINGESLKNGEDYFPLSFSAHKTINGAVVPVMREKGGIWFYDVKDLLDENKNNPHFDINDELKKEADKTAKKGSPALFIYNSGKEADNIQYNKHDTALSKSIPVVYITLKGMEKYLKNKNVTYKIAGSISIDEQKRTGHNVVAFINNNAANTVILGAHFDHLGFGEDHNALDTFHAVHNGADDNASGTAALIELSRILKDKGPKNNNYLFIAFSGEELGLYGSKYWLENPTVNISSNYMINMDMVGRYDTARKLVIGGYGTSPVWSEAIATTANPFNLKIKTDSSGSGPSDHAAFYRKDIPVLFFFTGSHTDYHKASDDADKINYDAQAAIVEYITALISNIDNKGKLTFLKTAEQQMGKSSKFTVSLGVIPDYGYTGTGMRIDGVSPGKVAEKAGLQAGDILLQLGDYKFVDVMSYMTALSKFKKGDKTTLKIKRGTEEKSYEIEF